MTVHHKNMHGLTHGHQGVVAAINGPLCVCGQRQFPHHKPRFHHDRRSVFSTSRRDRIKLMPNIVRSTGCRVPGVSCVRFVEKKAEA